MNKLPKHILEDLKVWNSATQDQRKTLCFHNKAKVYSGVRLTFSVQLTIKLIASGATNKLIADLMKLSIKTVEKHRQFGYYSTQTNSIACLTHWAIVNGLVVPGEYILF